MTILTISVWIEVIGFVPGEWMKPPKTESWEHVTFLGDGDFELSPTVINAPITTAQLVTHPDSLITAQLVKNPSQASLQAVKEVKTRSARNTWIGSATEVFTKWENYSRQSVFGMVPQNHILTAEATRHLFFAAATLPALALGASRVADLSGLHAYLLARAPNHLDAKSLGLEMFAICRAHMKAHYRRVMVYLKKEEEYINTVTQSAYEYFMAFQSPVSHPIRLMKFLTTAIYASLSLMPTHKEMWGWMASGRFRLAYVFCIISGLDERWKDLDSKTKSQVMQQERRFVWATPIVIPEM